MAGGEGGGIVVVLIDPFLALRRKAGKATHGEIVDGSIVVCK